MLEIGKLEMFQKESEKYVGFKMNNERKAEVGEIS